MGAIGEPKREIHIPPPDVPARPVVEPVVEPEPVTRPETPAPKVPVPAGS